MPRRLPSRRHSTTARTALATARLPLFPGRCPFQPPRRCPFPSRATKVSGEVGNGGDVTGDGPRAGVAQLQVVDEALTQGRHGKTPDRDIPTPAADMHRENAHVDHKAQAKQGKVKVTPVPPCRTQPGGGPSGHCPAAFSFSRQSDSRQIIWQPDNLRLLGVRSPLCSEDGDSWMTAVGLSHQDHLGARVLAKSASTSAHILFQSSCSLLGSFARAACWRRPARSGSRCRR